MSKPERIIGLSRMFAVAALACGVAGCASNHFQANNTAQPSLPVPASPTASNGYIGTQNPGYWSLTLDDVQKVYSYQPDTNASASAAPVQGGYSAANGIDNFGKNSNGSSAGMAAELASRIATLRPGDNTAAPVSMVQQSDCFAVTGNVRYLYAGMVHSGVTSGDATYPAYGSFVVSTTSDGKTWQFGDVRGYELPDLGNQVGPGVPPGADVGLPFPLSFPAACASGNGAGAVTANANAAIAVSPTFAFHPAGYFVMDQSAPSSSMTQSSTDQSGHSWTGFAMPATPLSAASIATGSYSGFVYEPVSSAATLAVSLSPAFGVSGGLAGGAYANDDLTQPPGNQYTLTLGKQDPILNGVFPAATLVMPDPGLQCPLRRQNMVPVKPGEDAYGNPTCTTRGVAIVAQPENKYVIYFTGLDGTTSAGSTISAYVLQMYLYQQ